MPSSKTPPTALNDFVVLHCFEKTSDDRSTGENEFNSYTLNSYSFAFKPCLEISFVVTCIASFVATDTECITCSRTIQFVDPMKYIMIIGILACIFAFRMIRDRH